MKIERLNWIALRGCKYAAAAMLFCALAVIGLSAQTFTSLLDFEYTNGAGPESLVRGFDGNFYGVTWSGGAHNNGTIFRLTPSGTVTTIYNFCSQSSCTDGANPQWLMRASDGNLYGATSQGGAVSCSGCGVVFKLTSHGDFSVLYAFPLSSGARPWGLIQGIDGNFYGVANSGGANDYGSLFKLTAAGQFSLLYSFCSLSNCADGSFPSGTLVQAADGTLYGATETGGAKGAGTIYKVAPDGTFTTLYSFAGRAGSSPMTLTQGTDGNFYGITLLGGVNHGGTIFRFTAAGQFTTLYSFCSQAGCADGDLAETLIQANDGNLYVGTGSGGDLSCGGHNTGCGTVAEFTSTGQLITVHTFEGTDGSDANVLLQDTDGSFYGTSLDGGDLNVSACSGSPGCGTAFHVSMGLAPFVTLTRNFGRAGQSGGILGRGLTGATGVFLNGTPAIFTVESDTLIQATVPAGASSGYVTVQTPSGTLTSNVPFQVKP